MISLIERLMTFFIRASLLILICSLCGCAITRGPNPQDPYECVNRKIFAFNTRLDDDVVKPIAKGYKKVVAWPVRKAASNFFSNIAEIATFANSLLQQDFCNARNSGFRFLTNTTFGVLGIFDVATHMGLKRNHTDMGITFAKWGDHCSPFIVLPIFGPSTIRDAFGWAYDYFLFTPYPYIRPKVYAYAISTYYFFTIRTDLLDSEPLIDEITIDPYAFQRDAYLQYREHKITGKLPDDDLVEDEVT